MKNKNMFPFIGTQKKSKLSRVCEILDTYMISDSNIGRMKLDNQIVETRFVLITPEVAKTLLNEYNEQNRPVSKINVSALVKQINENLWVLNGETITFNDMGNLTNGQHRLLSLIETGETLLFLVVTGLNYESFKTIDTGRKRQGSDILAIENIPNATAASAIVKFIYAFKNNKHSANRNSNRNLTNPELSDYLHSLPGDVFNSIKIGVSYNKKCDSLISSTNIGGFHYLFSEINPKLANEFFDKLCTGVNVEEGSPVIALRNKLIKAKIDPTYKLTQKTLVDNFVYAWEKFISGAKIKNLRIPEDYVPKL